MSSNNGILLGLDCLKAAMEERHLTQKAVTDQYGIDARTIRRMFRGKCIPRSDTLKIINTLFPTVHLSVLKGPIEIAVPCAIEPYYPYALELQLLKCERLITETESGIKLCSPSPTEKELTIGLSHSSLTRMMLDLINTTKPISLNAVMGALSGTLHGAKINCYTPILTILEFLFSQSLLTNKALNFKISYKQVLHPFNIILS